MTGIYKITNPKGAIYIGQAVNIERRETDYARAGCKSQRKIYNSIKKYGWKDHTFEILIECERSELNKYERLFGLQFDVLSRKNLNLNLPNNNENPKLVSDETRLKISKSNKGNQKRLNAVLSQETKDKISNSLKGNSISEITKLKISKSLQGHVVSELTINKLRERRSKKVINIKTLEIYDSAFILHKILKINYSTLRGQLNGLVSNRTDFVYLENYNK
jgi:group I intron endonuclease